MKEIFKTFIFNTSLPTFLITMLYVGAAYKKSGRPNSVAYELIPIIIPFLFGIFGTINKNITNNYGDNYSLLIGVLMGLTFSLIGRFLMQLPTKIFGFTPKNEHQVHYIAMALYALIFRFVVTPLKYFNK